MDVLHKTALNTAETQPVMIKHLSTFGHPWKVEIKCINDEEMDMMEP